MNIEIANRLLQFRKQNNLSQEALADKIGVSRQAVSKWERAEASPDTDNLILLSELYGVSLDELLKGENADKNENSAPEYDAEYQKSDGVSFKQGIHINDKNGTKVDIDRNGIFVNEGGEEKVYTDENGNVMYKDGENGHTADGNQSKWNKFPYPIIAVIVFLCWGFSEICFGWALSWIVFLTIPIYYTIVDSIFKRNPRHFAYPVLAAMLYIIFGFFDICGGWELGWIVFLTIPLYYWFCSFCKETEPSDDDE